MNRRIPGFVILAVAALLAGLAVGQTKDDPRTTPPPPDGVRMSVALPEATSDGEWHGTWYYVSRVQRMAIWMRETDGRPEMKLRIMVQASREAFETDWTSVADYEHSGRKGRFWLEFDERRSDQISGTWNWRFGDEGSARVETAHFTMWRTGDGRRLTLNLTGHSRWYEKDPAQVLHLDAAWTFVKAARHHALWAELPL